MFKYYMICEESKYLCRIKEDYIKQNIQDQKQKN